VELFKPAFTRYQHLFPRLKSVQLYFHIFVCLKSCDRSVGIVMGYGLEGCSSIPGRARDFSLPHNIQISSGTQVCFPGGKAAEKWG
jgi:hypothetical protein